MMSLHRTGWDMQTSPTNTQAPARMRKVCHANELIVIQEPAWRGKVEICKRALEYSCDIPLVDTVICKRPL